MAVKKVFRDVALEMSEKQPNVVDQITEEAPILEALPMQEASHGLHNVYEEVKSIEGGGLVDLDSELPEVDAESELKQIDLSILGGTMYVGEDKAKRFAGGGDASSGAEAYFARKMPLILRETGMAAERSLLYNNIRAFAINNGGDHLLDAGGSNDSNYSILAVKWIDGETTGLYDPQGFGEGAMMDVKPINGGELFLKDFKRADGTTVSVLSYGVRLKSYFGIQLANSRYVGAIVNVDVDFDNGDRKALPTAAQLDDLLDAVRADPGNTYLYMHNKVLSALSEYKGELLQVTVGVGDINRTVQAWNGIPVMTSYNFLKDTEPNVSVS